MYSKAEKVAEKSEGIMSNIDNASSYDDLIALLKRSGAPVEDILAIRDQKLLNFVMTPESSNAWLEDINSIEDVTKRAMSKIWFYRSLILDYPVAKYWKDYLELLLDLPSELSGVEKKTIDIIIEQALAVAKVDFDSEDLWRLIIKYTMESSGKEAARETYLTSLKSCHLGLDNLYSEFSSFSSEHFKDEYELLMIKTSKLYNSTKKRQRYVEKYEIPLRRDPNNIELWILYLEETAKFCKTTDQIDAIFNRSLIQGNSSTDLMQQWIQVWLLYIYLLYELDIKVESLESVLTKFVRSYPSLPTSYSEYIRNCEVFDNGAEKFALMKERIIATDLMHRSSYSEWEVLALAILAYDFHKVYLGKNYNLVEALYQDSTAFVNFAIQENNDLFHSVEKAAVTIFERLDDIDQARSIIKALVGKFKEQTEVWLFAYEFEKRHNSAPSEIAKTLETGASLALIQDWPERLIQEWLNYVQFIGTIDQYNHALTKANKLLKQVNDQRVEAEARKRSIEDTEPDSKRQKVEKRSREFFSIKVLQLPNDVSETDIIEFFQGIAIKNITKIEDQFAIIELATETDVLRALAKDQKPLLKHRVSITRHLESTLWVTNFPSYWEEKKISEVFGEYGALVEVRLPSQHGKKLRRFSYVEFEVPEDAQKAMLELNGKEFTDSAKKLSLVVKLSDPPVMKRAEEPNKKEVYVSNLNFNEVDEQVLSDFFTSCGKIDTITLPKPRDKSQKNNGFGFVRFEEISAIDKALKLKGSKLKDRTINVSKVNTKRTDPNLFNELNSISLSNLNRVTPWDRILSLAKEIGNVNKIELFTEVNMALVEFTNQADSGDALMKLQGKELDGNIIEIGLKSDLINKLDNKTPSKKKGLIPASVMKNI